MESTVDAPLTTQEIQEALRVCEAATPGPWTNNCGMTVDCGPEHLQTAGCIVAAIPDEGNGDDAEFIALARTLLPRALRALLAAREDTERLDEVIKRGLRVYCRFDGSYDVVSAGMSTYTDNDPDYQAKGRVAIDAARKEAPCPK